MACLYSCCFWFSLRLGGIIIAVASALLQLAHAVILCVAESRLQEVQEILTAWTKEVDLDFTKQWIDTIIKNLQGYITAHITLDVIYIICCIVYAYGAYRCNIYMMLNYLVMTLLVLVASSLALLCALFIFKKNTADIGVLIGASVAVGFYLLLQYYFWFCTVNLPIVIIETERRQYLETIELLERRLKKNGRRHFYQADEDEVIPAFPLQTGLPDVYAVQTGRDTALKTLYYN